MPAAPVEIDTTRPELIPACVALVAHPDDPRYQPLFGKDACHAALRRARAGQAAPARRSRKGHRRRDDLHVRRRHRRHLVARAVAAGARDHSGQRHAAADHVGQRPAGNPRDPAAAQAHYDHARGTLGGRRRGRGSSSCSASRATSSAIRGRSRITSSSTRRAIGRSRSSRAGSGSSRRWRSASALLARGREMHVVSRRTCARATRTG